MGKHRETLFCFQKKGKKKVRRVCVRIQVIARGGVCENSERQHGQPLGGEWGRDVEVHVCNCAKKQERKPIRM